MIIIIPFDLELCAQVSLNKELNPNKFQAHSSDVQPQMGPPCRSLQVLTGYRLDFVRNQESEAAEAGSQRHSFANMAHIATEQHQQLHQESSDNNTKTFVIEGYFSMSMIMK